MYTFCSGTIQERMATKKHENPPITQIVGLLEASGEDITEVTIFDF